MTENRTKLEKLAKITLNYENDKIRKNDENPNKNG